MLLLLGIKLPFSVLLPRWLVGLSTTGLSRRLWLWCAMESRKDADVLAGDRDSDDAVCKELAFYAANWQSMAVVENRAVYGPVDPSNCDRLALLRAGQMINASLRIVEDGARDKLEARWVVGAHLHGKER